MQEVNEMEQSLYTAIQMAADGALATSGLPKTIECKITEIKDSGIGLYLVSYMGNEFDVYSSSPSIAYKEGDNVLVIVPDGDVSKIKYIIGSVAPNGDLYSNTEVVDNFIPADGIIMKFNDIDLCSYTPDEGTVRDHASTAEIELLLAYLKNKEYNFTFMADVSTNLPSSQQNCGGQYGITLEIPILRPSATADSTLNEDVIKIPMTVNNILGNPYSLILKTPQRIDLSFPENFFYNGSSQTGIRLISTVGGGFSINPSIETTDIHFSNIRLQCLRAMNFSDDNGNRLYIEVKNDSEFFTSGGQDKKILEPKLMINKRETSLNGYNCYWYVKDNSIQDYGNEFYETHGGYGWKCLNRKQILDTADEGDTGFQWITNDYSLEINKEDVLTSLVYKCIIVSNGLLLQAEIEIQNLQPTYEFGLATDNGTVTFSKDYGVIPITAFIRRMIEPSSGVEYTYEMQWLRYKTTSSTPYAENEGTPAIIRPATPEENAEDGYQEWQKKTIEKVTYPCSLVDGTNRIECTFYECNKTTGDRKNAGTLSLLVSTEEIYDYKIIVQNDRYEYKYDAEGDSPMVAAYDGPKSSIADEPKIIKPISFIILDKYGNELSAEEYAFCEITWQVSVDSLILPFEGTGITPTSVTENYKNFIFYGKDNSDFYYAIKNKFEPNKNNTIILKIVYKDAVLTTDIHLNFLKDGQSGTNGTRFSAEICYNGYAYGEVSEDAITGRYIRNRFLPVFLLTGSYSDSESMTSTCYLYKPEAIRIDPSSMEYTFNKIIPWNNLSNEDKTFELKVYKDGELITGNLSDIYTVRWSMLDPITTKTLFQIQADPENEYKGILEGRSYTDPYFKPYSKYIEERKYAPYIDDESSPCNIIKAEITIKSSATEANRQQKLYAFYPVDFIVARTLSGSDYSSDNEYNFFDIKDGYDSVMYDMDGTLPQAGGQNSKPFLIAPGYSLHKKQSGEEDIIDYIDFEDPEYKWYAFHQDNFVERNPQGVSYNVKPANKYDNGEAKGLIGTYVKIKHRETWEDDESCIENAIDQLENDIYELNQQLEIYARFKANLDLFQKELDIGQNFSYNNYIENLENSRSMLIKRLDIFLQLKELKDKFEDINSFIFNYPIIITPNPESAITFCDNIINIMLHFGDPNVADRKGYNDIPNYFVNSGITSVNFNRNTFESLYGLAAKDILNWKVQSVNDILAKYFTNLSTLRTLTSELNAYINLRTLMNDYVNNNTPLNELTSLDNEGQEFKDHKEFISISFDKLGKDTSIDYTSIKNILIDFRNRHIKLTNSFYNDKYNDKYNYIKKQRDDKNAQKNDFVSFARLEYIGYYKSIHLYLNYHSMSNLNDWDGTKVYVDKDNQYILAPQMGAGYKESDNSYTGLVMGITNLKAGNTTDETADKFRIGLLGLSHGQQSLFISAKTGSAVFGKMGPGQIILDPTNDCAQLYSSNYWYNYNKEGMPSNYGENNKTGKGTLINLTESYIHFGENVTNYIPPNLKDKNGNFDIDILEGVIDGYFERIGANVGKFSMTSADQNKALYYGINYLWVGVAAAGHVAIITYSSSEEDENLPKITVANNTTTFDGSVGGQNHAMQGVIFQYREGSWINVSSEYGASAGLNYFYTRSRSSSGFYIDTPWSIAVPTVFESTWIIEKGIPKSGANITSYGRIYSGKHDKLKSTAPGFYLDNTGLSIGSKFKVQISANDGNECKLLLGNGAVTETGEHWTIDANPAGHSYIAYNTSTFDGSKGVYLGTDGIRLGNTFKVTAGGALTSVSGEIGGWKISSNVLYSPSGLVALYSNGTLVGPNWRFDETGGIIGLLTLGADGSIKGNGFELDSNGFRLTKNGTAKLNFDTNGNLTIRGTIYASAGEFTGKITATSGKIGDWSINDGSGINSGIVYTGASVANVNTQITPGKVCAKEGYFNTIICTVNDAADGRIQVGTAQIHDLTIFSHWGSGGASGYIPIETVIQNEISDGFYTKTQIDDLLTNLRQWCQNTFSSKTHTHNWGGSYGGGNWGFSGHDTVTINSVPGSDTVNISGSGTVGGTTSAATS